MDLLRTPDSRFDGLSDWPYEPRYVEAKGGRLHYVDVGEGEPVVLLHGEPTWSYLYRKVIPPLAEGHRVLALDLLGFGRSDKPARAEDHDVRLHVESVRSFFDALDLRGVTLVVHDWGGLIGLSALPELDARVARIVVMNTWLPDGTEPFPDEWHAFREFLERVEDPPIGKLVSYGCIDGLAREARAAYDAPFPEASFKVAPRVFPQLMPYTPEKEAVPILRRAREHLASWRRPFLIACSDGDPITRGVDALWEALVPSPARSRVTIEGAGHFLMEDRGEDVARRILAFIEKTS